MTDYRSFVESRLADVDRRRAELENERERLITTLGVLDEADAFGGGTTARPAKETTPDRPPVTTAIVNILKSSGRMMTADEIHDSLLQAHEVSRDLMHSGFYRLKKRGTAFNDGKRWGLVDRDLKTALPSPSDGQSTSMPTNPTGHQLQPSLSRSFVQE